MEATYERYGCQAARLSDGSVHMLWSADDIAQGMLCGRSRATAVTHNLDSHRAGTCENCLLRARVTCQKCRDRSMAIVGGEEPLPALVRP